MANHSHIEKALTKAYIDGGFDLQTQYPNRSFEPPVDGLWARFSVLPTQPSTFTLGTNGYDEHLGLMQIDLYAPFNKGLSQLHDKCDEVLNYFVAGKAFAYEQQQVLIINAGKNQGFFSDYWTVPLTINYRSYLTRANL